MSNALYAAGRQKILEGSIAWLTDNVKCALVRSSTYTPNLATDAFLSDVTAGGAVVSTSANLASKTSTGGVADAADTVFTAVPAGAACQYVVIYKDTGTPSTSPLIALIDTAGGSPGLPVTPSGVDVNLQFDNGANKIFKL